MGKVLPEQAKVHWRLSWRSYRTIISPLACCITSTILNHLHLETFPLSLDGTRVLEAVLVHSLVTCLWKQRHQSHVTAMPCLLCQHIAAARLFVERSYKSLKFSAGNSLLYRLSWQAHKQYKWNMWCVCMYFWHESLFWYEKVPGEITKVSPKEWSTGKKRKGWILAYTSIYSKAHRSFHIAIAPHTELLAEFLSDADRNKLLLLVYYVWWRM